MPLWILALLRSLISWPIRIIIWQMSWRVGLVDRLVFVISRVVGLIETMLKTAERAD